MADLENINAVRIVELDKRMSLYAETSQQAVRLAANDLRAKLDAMNEFRAALKDQSTTFVPHNELEHEFERIDSTIQLNTSRLDKIEAGSRGAGSLLGWIFGGVAVFVAVASLLLPHLK